MPHSRSQESEEFDFQAGDHVRVRVRENGTRGNIKAKFEAEVLEFLTGFAGSDKVRLDPPWKSTHGVRLRHYDAEFEVLGGDDGAA